MLLPMDILPWLLVVAVVGLIWWSALGAKMTARRAAQRACREAEVRFIDELALQRLVPARNKRGRWCIRRVYGFEFYWSGAMRHSGCVTMHGQRVAAVRLDPYPLHEGDAPD